tara:strand:+ start:456 stop:647 length:192 start_codon:yes stop_codon:yes gene_type:complete
MTIPADDDFFLISVADFAYFVFYGRHTELFFVLMDRLIRACQIYEGAKNFFVAVIYRTIICSV